jgi:peptide/nickel transport system substrate-binding protein
MAKRRLKILVVLPLVLGIAGGAGAAPVRGGQMIYARAVDSLFLDPVLNDANADIWVLTNLYDTLLQPSADGKSVVPGLASGYSLAPDGLSMELTLRPNIKFTDGTPILASDVKFSLDRARDPKAGEWNFMLASIQAIEAPVPDRVVLRLAHPDPTLPAALATFNAGILPERAFMAEPGATMEEKANRFALHPIGSGPFRFVEWHRNLFMQLERNPYYWAPGADGKPLPYLDALRFEIVPDDATRILKLQGAEVDGAEFIPLARAAELAGDPELRMELFPSTETTYVTLQTRPKLKDGTPNPLSDVRVRQALNYALDKDAFIHVVNFGKGTPMRSFIPSTTPLALTDAPLYPFDPAKAKALLAEAGFAQGFDMSIMLRAGSANEIAIASVAQQMWGEIGVRLTLEQLDNASETARYRAADFQARVGGWTNDIADPSEVTSYFAYSPNIQSQHSGFDDPVINADFESGQHETDPARRAALYREIQERFAAAAPIAFLYESPYAVALRKPVHGFVQIPLGNNIFTATTLGN